MKNIFYTLIAVIIIILIMIIHIQDDYNYISSKYSKYCYVNGYNNKNIKIKVYYKSLEDCGKPLKI